MYIIHEGVTQVLNTKIQTRGTLCDMTQAFVTWRIHMRVMFANGSNQSGIHMWVDAFVRDMTHNQPYVMTSCCEFEVHLGPDKEESNDQYISTTR